MAPRSRPLLRRPRHRLPQPSQRYGWPHYPSSTLSAHLRISSHPDRGNLRELQWCCCGVQYARTRGGSTARKRASDCTISTIRNRASIEGPFRECKLYFVYNPGSHPLEPVIVSAPEDPLRARARRWPVQDGAREAGSGRGNHPCCPPTAGWWERAALPACFRFADPRATGFAPCGLRESVQSIPAFAAPRQRPASQPPSIDRLAPVIGDLGRVVTAQKHGQRRNLFGGDEFPGRLGFQQHLPHDLLAAQVVRLHGLANRESASRPAASRYSPG